MNPSIRWDIYCRVVDNFGDAGVCWRLARQLATEHGLAVTLWIDNVATLARIVPQLDAGADDQAAQGLRVRRFCDNATRDSHPADVVIEGFGCGLPEHTVDAMAAAARRPAWVVLEYLSAEPWIDASQALPSPHPGHALTRSFWFPGFTPRSGGLLREAGLLERRDATVASALARQALLDNAGVGALPDATLVSLFCYANPALPALLECWAEGDDPLVCLVPNGIAGSELDRFLAGQVPHPGAPVTRGRLTVAAVPWVDQDGFDQRLWQCDFNFVRGEDSLVRALWAGRPFVWQLYAQDEDVHLVKMDAFLTRYEADLPPALRSALRAFWYGWNMGAPDAVVAAWPEVVSAMPALRRRGRAWAAQLAGLPDLATRLVNHCEIRL